MAMTEEDSSSEMKKQEERTPYLPENIVEQILKHLPLLKAISLGAVCKTWAIASHCCKQTATQTPFLLMCALRKKVTTPQLHSAIGDYELVSILDGKSYKLKFPGITSVPLASYDGWLLHQDPKLRLHNPVTGCRIECPLFPRRLVILKELVFANPDAPGYTVAVISISTVVTWRPGNVAWSMFERKLADDFVEATIANGNLYIWKQFEKLEIFNFLSSTSSQVVIVSNWLGLFARFPEIGHSGYDLQKYMVESNGDILLLSLWRSNPHDKVGPLLAVYQLDTKKMSWNAISELGDRVLFVNLNSSASIPASKMGCKGGTVYIADECQYKLYKFEMEGGWFTFSGEKPLGDRAHLWFVPNFIR